MRILYIVAILILGFALTACSNSGGKNSGGDDGGDITGPPPSEPVVIVDRTGKQWDISHAVRNYGFNENGFQFGLGPDAIRPINDFEMVSAGEPGFPSANQNFLVIGTEINDDRRAYPIYILKTNEIVNEFFDTTHVAVAY